MRAIQVARVMETGHTQEVSDFNWVRLVKLCLLYCVCDAYAIHMHDVCDMLSCSFWQKCVSCNVYAVSFTIPYAPFNIARLSVP